MIKRTFCVLEFHTLLNILSDYASSPLGKSDCFSLEPLDDLTRIESEQKLVSEMKLLLQMKGFFSVNGLTDIGHFLRTSQTEDSCLDPEGLLSVFRTAEVSKQAKKFILSHQLLCPRLYDLTKEMPLFRELRQTIQQAISPNGTILDSASSALKGIRLKKTLLRGELQKKLENIRKSKGLSTDGDDHPVSIRDGRYLIPLRTDMKSRVVGIIHDYSRTQATCFFEPIEVIQDNNKLAELSHLEKEKELRILRALTAAVRNSAEDLWKAQTILGKLDGLCARAQLSRAMKCVRPIVSQRGDVDLRQAINPILGAMASGGDPPVPSDILLDKNQNVMIISGPNRGGKTVTLKTIGLLSLMAQSGLHIPAAEGSSLPVFKKIMAEIGDDQNIQAGLSTFSAHISHLRDMIEQADQESLVIIDEPGMGTDPDEGAALAMAILDELAEKGSFVAISTHLNRLKTYGLLRERAKNAHMEFDLSTNRPTFSLKYGTPGTSYAFEIAADSGIGSQVLEQAKGYLDQDEVRLNRLIDKLHCLKEETSFEKLEAERIKERYRAKKKKVAKALERLESDRRAILAEKRAEAENLVEEAKEKFKALINAFKKTAEPSRASIKGRFDQISKDLVEAFAVEEEGRPVDVSGFKTGQWVRHRRLHQEGKILSIDYYNSKAVIMAGSVRLSVRLKDLEVMPDREASGPDESYGHSAFPDSSASPREINVIGYRVADALPLIDKTIDKAIMEGELSLRIVHGYGTGRLKEAIREHLKRSSCVKRISGADSQSGGEAITVVALS